MGPLLPVVRRVGAWWSPPEGETQTGHLEAHLQYRQDSASHEVRPEKTKKVNHFGARRPCQGQVGHCQGSVKDKLDAEVIFFSCALKFSPEKPVWLSNMKFGGRACHELTRNKVSKCHCGTEVDTCSIWNHLHLSTWNLVDMFTMRRPTKSLKKPFLKTQFWHDFQIAITEWYWPFPRVLQTQTWNRF